MKKKTILVLLALLLALTMTVLLVACNDNPGPVDPTDQDPCKNGHVEDDGEVTVQPTCQTEGTRTYRCKVCGEVVRTEPVDKTDHVWDNGTQTQEPGCGTVGKMTFHCTVEGCNETKTENIPATGVHTKGTWVPEEPATCKKEGTHDYYQCTNCSAKLDDDGNEYDAADLVIPKAAHTWDNGVVTPATCEAEGQITYTCDICGETSIQTIPANGHTYGELIPQQDATCEHTGVEAHYMCSVCCKLFDQAKEQVEETDLEIGLAKHTLDEVTGKPATCTEDGFETYYKCNVCNKLFADDKAETPIEQPKTLTATGHKPIPYGDKAATCTEAGYANGKICSECGTVIVQPKRVAPLGHAYVYTPVGDGVHHTVTCSRNNDYHETELCASIGRWMSDNAEYHYHKCDKCKYECDIANHTFQDKKCTVCGADQSEVIVRVEGQLDHIEISVAAAIEYIKQNYNDGTPVTIIIGANYTANVTFDGNINVTLDLGGFGIGMSTFSLVVDGQADVTLTNGTLTGKVQFNGGKLALEGVGGSYTIALKSGLKCDKADVTVNGAPLDHAWNNGQVTTPPTCESTGTRTYTCTRCQATRTEDEPAKGHTYGTLIPQQDPTCTATGTAAHYQCADCRKLFVDENGSKKEVQADELVLDKIEHTYGKLIPQQDATCVADGHKAYFQCEVCKQYFDEEKQPAEWKDLVLTSGGHDFDTTKWKYDGTNHWYECKNDSTHHDQQAPHSWDYRKGENGSHEHYCTVCGYVDKTDATCTPAAPAPADSHDENHGLNIQDGWYADADYHWQICKDCGATINREAHVWTGDEGNKSCQTCGHKFFDVKISDGDKLDQSARTIAEAFDWITANGDKTKTYTVTLTHNRSDDSTNTVTVPEGYKVVLVLGDYSVTYTKGKLSVGKGSELTVQGNGKFVIGTIEYSGGKLVLPDGEYNFEIKGGYTCLTADITVGTSHIEHAQGSKLSDLGNGKHSTQCTRCGANGTEEPHTYTDWTKESNSQHKGTCACGATKLENHTYNNFVWAHREGVDGFGKHSRKCDVCAHYDVQDCTIKNNTCEECDRTYTLEEVVAYCNGLSSGDELPGTYTFSGVATRVEHTQRGDHTSWFITVNGKDGFTAEIQCFDIVDGTFNVSDIVVGAKITVSGTLQNFKEHLEFNGATLDDVQKDSVTILVQDNAVAVGAEFAIYADDDNEFAREQSIQIGEEVKFKLNVTKGKLISVMVDEQVLVADAQGYYSFTVTRATTIIIELGGINVPSEETYTWKANASPKGIDGTAWENGKKYTDTDIGGIATATIDSSKTTYTGAYNGSDWRLYESEDNKITIKPVAGIKIISITFTTTNNNKGALFYGAEALSSTYVLTVEEQTAGVTFTVDHTSGSNNGRIDIIAIDIVFKLTTNHNFGEWIAQTEADCTHDGIVGHYVCTEHDYCQGKFYDSEGEFIPEEERIVDEATGHSFELPTSYHARKDSTCQQVGNEDYWECDYCHKKFASNQDTSRDAVVKENTVIDKKDHDFTNQPWKSDDNGNHYQECKTCNPEVAEVAHSNSQHCNQSGYGRSDSNHWRVCSLCGYDYGKTIENDAHIYNQPGNLCVCGQAKPHVHQFVDVEGIPAGCETTGVEAHVKCSECNMHFDSKETAQTTTGYTEEEAAEHYKIPSSGHSYASEFTPIPDTNEHGQQCSKCQKYNPDTKTEHVWEGAVTFDPEAPDSATHHTVKCTGCSATTQGKHTLEYTQLTVGGEITQDIADHKHQVSCECGYSARENHDFGTGSKNQRHDCLCGEKLCQYGEETAHVSGTISPKTSDNANYLFPFNTSNASYADSTNEILIGGITFAFKQLAHNVRTGSDGNVDVIQMRKAQSNQPAGYLYNTSAIASGIKSISITISHTKGHIKGDSSVKPTAQSTIIAGNNTKVLVIYLGKDEHCNDKTVEVKVDEVADPTFTWTDDSGANYKYFKIEHAHSSAVYIKSIDINYSIQEGHHVVDTWTPVEGHEPTCTKEGQEQGVCLRCGETVTKEAPKQGHKWEWKPATSATCTEPAYVGQWYCSVCHKYTDDYTEERTPYLFEDSDLMSQERIVDKDQNKGQPLGHNLVWKSDDKEHWKECDRAGCEEAEKHTQFDKTTHVISYHEVDEQYHSLECECGRSFANEKHDGLADDGSCSKCQNGIKTFTAGATGTDSLNEALTAVAASGGTITLNKDYRGDGAEFKPSTTQEITIDANGNTLTLTTALSIETTGTVKLAGNIIAQQGITISGSGEVVLNGATVTGNVSISEGTLTLNGATITGNITLTVGSAEVYFADDGSSTITGTVTINTTPENAESYLYAVFEQEQTAYTLKVEGVTCDALSGSVIFGEQETPISHTYSEEKPQKVDGTYHTRHCVTCEKDIQEKHNFDAGDCECGEKAPAKTYRRITSITDITSGGKYLIVCESSKAVFNGNCSSSIDSASNAIKTITITDYTISSDATIDTYSITITLKTDNSYSVYLNGAKKYVSLGSQAFKFVDDESSSSFAISFSGNNVEIKGATQANSLKYNASWKGFRAYGSSSNQTAIQLYKLS